MTLFEKINDDLKTAMKARDKVKLEALRNIKKVMIEVRSSKGAGTELSDEESLKIISKLAKQGSDSAKIYREQGRTDLFEQEMEQVAIYENYLPAQLSLVEITKAVNAIITETGAASMKDMGKVMGIANKKLAGQAEGKQIAEVVKKMLQ